MNQRLVFASLLALAATAPVQAADVDVGVSINIGQPGFYGRIDIGNVPPPVVMYPQPVIIARPAVVVAEPKASARSGGRPGTRASAPA